MELVENIKNIHPLVHCITNIVTVNDCANALLAVGASPTMAHHPMEVEEIAGCAKAVVLNMGATECYEAMLLAGVAAHKANIPIVIDPVGASGATYRRTITKELIAKVHPVCIRGNYSELKSLATDTMTIMGVDSSVEVDAELSVKHTETAPIDECRRDSDFLNLLKEYARATGAIVVATGPIDYITDGNSSYKLEGGSELMSRITGSGCMESAVMGAFLATGRFMGVTDTDSVISCCKFMKTCGERAEEKTYSVKGGTMTFRQKFIDEMFQQ